MRDRRAELALGDLEATPIQRTPHRPLLLRCWELRENITVYDAADMALAKPLQTTLLTADRRLADRSSLAADRALAGRQEAKRPASRITPALATA